MTIVHGESDDIVVIDGSTYAESEIDCAEKDVRIFFTDGTIIRVGYPKKNKAIWQIDVEKRGNAAQLHTACEIEDDRNYSDVFEIAAEVRSHELVQKKIPEPENEPKAEMDKSHQKFSGINCLDCHYRHENGNCTAVGGFCTSVPAAYCKLIPELKETLAKAMHWVMRLNDLEWCEMTPEEREDVANFVKKIQFIEETAVITVICSRLNTKEDTMKYEQPKCFHPEENNPYPLCVGRDASCAHCCCWTDYDTPEDEERAERLICGKKGA